MNKQQAMDAGYNFHGCYERSFNKIEVLDTARELRKAGNKAITVKVPDSKYSRGGRGHGYAVYWIQSEANKELKAQEQRDQKRKNIKARIEKLYSEIEELEGELCNI